MILVSRLCLEADRLLSRGVSDQTHKVYWVLREQLCFRCMSQAMSSNMVCCHSVCVGALKHMIAELCRLRWPQVSVGFLFLNTCSGEKKIARCKLSIISKKAKLHFRCSSRFDWMNAAYSSRAQAFEKQSGYIAYAEELRVGFISMHVYKLLQTCTIENPMSICFKIHSLWPSFIKVVSKNKIK